MYNFYSRKVCTPSGYVIKLLLIMWLTTLILISAMMKVSANSFAQKISLSQKNLPLVDVFEKIRKQTGFDFVVTKEMLSKSKSVNIHMINSDLKDVLSVIFKTQPLDFQIIENMLIVSRKDQHPVENESNFEKNTIDISGIVRGMNEAPLPGATIKIKAANRAHHESPTLIRDLSIAAWDAAEIDKAKMYALTYLNLVDDKTLLNKENIELVSLYTKRSSDLGFQFFKRNIPEIDAILGKGAVQTRIEWCISQDVDDLISAYKGKPDWVKIYRQIKEKFPGYADQVVIKGKIRYYKKVGNWPGFARNVELFFSGLVNMPGANELNGYAYDIFLSCNQERFLVQALKWTKQIVGPDNDHSITFTQAGLLYKLGKSAQALSLLNELLTHTEEQDKEGLLFMIEGIKKGKKKLVNAKKTYHKRSAR